MAAYKRLKRHKTSTLSGWTRELLYPVLFNSRDDLSRNFLTQIFTEFINVDISHSERQLFTTPILIILKYASIAKRRPLLLLDCILKISWHLVLMNSDDEAISSTGHVYGLRGQTQVAVHSITAALQQSQPVVGMDAVSAFPTICRKALFAYLKSKPYIYGKSYALFNMLYSQPVVAVHFIDGNISHRFNISTGTLQGCVSASRAYICATIATCSAWKQSTVHVIDDVHIVKDAFNITTPIIQGFLNIKQKLDGPKKRLFHHDSNLDIPIDFPIQTVTSTPFKILGAYFAFPHNTVAQISNLLYPYIEKIKSKCNSIVALPTTIQCKLLILRSIMWNYLYIFETSEQRCRDHLAQTIDRIHQETFERITNMTLDQATQVRLFFPIEDGGFGLVPFTELHNHLYANACNRSKPLLAGKHLPFLHFPESSTYNSLRNMWTQVFKQHIVAVRAKSISLTERNFLRCTTSFTSWICCWPTNYHTSLRDDHYITGLQVRFDCLQPPDRQCLTDGIRLSSMSRNDFTQHFFTCKSCAAKHNILKHEHVVKSIHQTLRFHNIIVHIPKSGEVPKPENHRGGTDLFVHSTDVWHIDVKVCSNGVSSQSTLKTRTRFVQTMNWYKNFENIYKAKTIPFCISIQGIIDQLTIEKLDLMLENSTHPKATRHAIFVNTQMALIKGIHQGLQLVGLSVLDANVSQNLSDGENV